MGGKWSVGWDIGGTMKMDQAGNDLEFFQTSHGLI